MAVDYNALLQTLQSEKMDTEEGTTYTRSEAYNMIQDWRNEEEATAIKAADEQMQAARDAYFQAIETYKQACSESNFKLHEILTAFNQCYYKSDSASQVWTPGSFVAIEAKRSLMQVTHNQVNDSELHVKETE
jgi:hypothetical protein